MDLFPSDLFCNSNSALPILAQCKAPIGILSDKLSYFESVLCNWPTAIPLHNLWVILIQPNSRNLKKNILNVARTHEPKAWEVESALNTTTNGLFDATNTGNYDLHNVIGCIFAQKINIPGFAASNDFIGGASGNNNGLLKSPIIGNRQNNSNLDIGFLETNHSFTDYFIRPWIGIVNHYGLVARENEFDIKSRIIVLQLGKTRQCAPNVIRKKYTFYDAVPISVENDELGYSPDTAGGIIKNTSWTYRHYSLDEVVGV